MLARAAEVASLRGALRRSDPAQLAPAPDGIALLAMTANEIKHVKSHGTSIIHLKKAESRQDRMDLRNS
jgi:hypothetical protein